MGGGWLLTARLLRHGIAGDISIALGLALHLRLALERSSDA